jgi:alpha-L-rhamnosidase
MEWAFRDLVGIDTSGPGFGHIVFRPGPPSPESNPEGRPINWAKAEYDSIRGPIRSHWQRKKDTFELDVTLPANTRATVYLPAAAKEKVTERGASLEGHPHVKVQGVQGDRLVLEIGSGRYRFQSEM